jgi:hypothetical protein
MIWGETDEQKISRLRKWRRTFAWWPVQLSDGRRAWLCHVEKRVVRGFGRHRTDWFASRLPGERCVFSRTGLQLD